MSPDKVEERRPLPRLKRALERRYPGVTVNTCERRRYVDKTGEGVSIMFMAKNAEVLIGYGLARRHPRIACELLAMGAPEVEGSGSCGSGHAAYVCHHCYDGESGSHTYPPKWVVTEYERLMRRVRKSKRPSEPPVQP